MNTLIFHYKYRLLDLSKLNSLCKILIISFLCSTTIDLIAQQGFAFVGGQSQVIKHKDGLLFDTPPPSTYFSLRYLQRASGSKCWHNFWGKPVVSSEYSYIHFGNEDVLGTGHAFMRGLHISIIDQSNWSVYGRVATGVGIASTIYDRRTNPTNNAISSTINNASSLGLTSRINIMNHWSVQSEAILIHMSNGLSSSPNSGINTYHLGLGLQYDFADNQGVAYQSTTPLDTTRRWVVDLHWHFSRSEFAVTAGGPKYPNHAVGVGLGYRYHPLLVAILGVDYEYNGNRYAFRARNFVPEDIAKAESRSITLFLANEFWFDKWLLRLQTGYYVPVFHQRNDVIYIKAGMHYALPRALGIQPIVGVVLKSHFAVAEYVALSVGLRL